MKKAVMRVFARRWAARVLLAGMFLVAMGGRDAAVAQVTYFDSARLLEDLSTKFGLAVSEVYTGDLANKAGLRVGDKIVGLDGLRVRSENEYSLVRFYFGERTDMTLTVLRRGVLTDIYVANLAPIRCAGFSYEGPESDHLERMDGWNIESAAGRRLFRALSDAGPANAKKNDDAVSDLFDAFDAKGPRLVAHAGRLIALFPARGWEAVVRLMDSGAEEDKQWCRALLDVYLHLRFREPVDAGKIMATSRLVETAPDPFLKELAKFYGKIIESPPQWGRTKIWEEYGVDLFFFVVCYPYPVLQEDKGKSHFAFDPLFQRLFDQANDGAWADTDEMRSAAMGYVARSSDSKYSLAEQYLFQVRAALLSPDGHGGWPYRSHRVHNVQSRKKVVAELRIRLAEKPDERILTALALLCPHMLNDDVDEFKKIYRILFDAGPRIRGAANTMVRDAVYIWRKGPEWSQVIQEYESREQKPVFYEYIRKAHPAFRRLAGRGSYYRYDWSVEDPDHWLVVSFDDIAMALEHPLSEADIDAAWESALAGKNTAAIRRALDAVTRDLSAYPRQLMMDRFVWLAARMPAGEAVAAATSIFSNHRTRGFRRAINVDGIFVDWLRPFEDGSYSKVLAEINELPPPGEECRKKAAEIYRRAGVPSVCMMLARRLALSGDRAGGTLYHHKAWHFLDSLTSAHARGNENGHLRLWAYRDMLSSAPEFKSSGTALFRDAALKQGTDSAYVLAAIDDECTGRIDDAIGNLAKSLERGLRKDGGTIIYRGGIYRAVKWLREDIIYAMFVISKLDLSSKQMRALATLDGIDYDKLLGWLAEVKEEPYKGPIRFTVDLDDGSSMSGVPALTSLVVRTSYATVPLPLSEVQSVTFRDERRKADALLRNGDILTGVIDLGKISFRGAEKVSSVDGGRILYMTLYKSRTDRFRSEVLRHRSQTEEEKKRRK